MVHVWCTSHQRVEAPGEDCWSEDHRTGCAASCMAPVWNTWSPSGCATTAKPVSPDRGTRIAHASVSAWSWCQTNLRATPERKRSAANEHLQMLVPLEVFGRAMFASSKLQLGCCPELFLNCFSEQCCTSTCCRILLFASRFDSARQHRSQRPATYFTAKKNTRQHLLSFVRSFVLSFSFLSVF